MQTKIILIPLFRRVQLFTNGTTTPVWIDIPNERFRGILPFAVGLTLYTLTEGANATIDCEWNVGFWSGFDRDHGQAAIIPIAASWLATNGSIKAAAYTTTANFNLNLESRLQAGARNRATVSGLQTIFGSAVLAVETVGT